MSWVSKLRCLDFFKTGAGGIVGLAAPGAYASRSLPCTSSENRIKAHLHSIAAIDAHDHLRPSEKLGGRVRTAHGTGMNLYGIWFISCYSSTNQLTVWITTIAQSWDTASKSGEFNGYSVCTTWGYYDEKFYLLDVFRQQLTYPELERAFRSQWDQIGILVRSES